MATMFYNATSLSTTLCSQWGNLDTSIHTDIFTLSGGSICVPTQVPVPDPTALPLPAPSSVPIPAPTPNPTLDPSPFPTHPPSPKPSAAPSELPTALPTHQPTPSPTKLPIPNPTPEPTHVPTDMPAPLPTAHPTPVPTYEPTRTPKPSVTPAPTPGDESSIEVSLSLSSSDNTACVAADDDSFIKKQVAAAMSTDQMTFSINDVKSYSVDGCANSRRRRRKLMSTVAVITIDFEVSASAGGTFQTTQGMYETTTTTLKAAISTLTAQIAAQFGDVSIETIKVALVRRTPSNVAPIEVDEEPVVEMPYYAGSDCPNGCSGHGQCSTNGCVCYRNWGNGDEEGGACDTRICPEEIAWVDTPRGENSAHRLAECAGRGVCDRETGDCVCFPGYEGKGCKRSSCPNGCSGHGTCEYLAEMRNDLGDDFKWTGSKSTRNQYDFEFPLLWDAHKTRGCVCDPKYTGVDCSIRMCPRGDFSYFHALDKTPETQMIVISNLFTPGTDVDKNDMSQRDLDYKTSDTTNGTDANGEFALTFRSTLNEEYTTYTLNAYNLTAIDVENALNSLPNKVIEDAQVTLYRDLPTYNRTTYGYQRFKKDGVFPYQQEFNYTWYETDLVMLVTYKGSMTTGDQYALECRTAYCGAGCQPKIEHPLDFKQHSDCKVMNNLVASIGVNWECSGRGLCSSTGVCECFEGYTDEYCSTKTAIV